MHWWDAESQTPMHVFTIILSYAYLLISKGSLDLTQIVQTLLKASKTPD